jgi:homeobox-leucine zipper protein
VQAQHERSENSQLRNENERLRIENITMREAIKHASCPSCGDIGVGSGDGMPAAGDENQLRSDNARLREEVRIWS